MNFPDIDPIAFQVGPIAVRSYGIAFAATFGFGWFYIITLLKRPHLWGVSFEPNMRAKIDDLLVYIVAGVILGGRIGHVLLYRPSHYFSNPLEIFAVWEGGMSFHGGLLGTIIAILLFARRANLDRWLVGDLIAACAPMGILFVRSANFVNGEIVGSPSNLPWAILFPGYLEPRHPAMLYEALLEGALLFVILAICIFRFRTLRYTGLTAAIFLIGYAITRAFCELFKFADHRMIWPEIPITKGMLYSIPMLILGVALIWVKSLRSAENNKQVSG